MIRTMKRAGLVGSSLVTAALIVFGLCSSAGAESFSLTQANANLATQGAGPYGTIEVTGTGTTWHAAGTGLNSFVFGDGGAIALNINPTAGTVTLGACTSTCSNAGSGNEDGFGSFTFRVDDGSGFSSPVATFGFDFTTQNSISAADLIIVNGDGAQVAAHMALASNTACTGFAADGGTGGTTNDDPTNCHRVAEPSSLLFAGSALALAGMLSRRWKRRR